jgi:hypothetical protein
VGSQCAQIIKHFLPEPIGSPLVRVLFTKGMIAADFLGDPTGTGLDMPSQTHRASGGLKQEAVGLFFLAAIALRVPVASTAARRWLAWAAYGRPAPCR